MGRSNGALNKYLEQKDAVHAGRRPREASEGVTVKELCSQFINVKAAARDAGEIAHRTWDDYQAAADMLVRQFGKSRLVEDLGPEDFERLRAVTDYVRCWLFGGRMA